MSAPTILVVEDEVLVRLMIARHLRETGFRVIEACHAGEALDALESDETIDLLFTDVLMPGVMNGIMLARWVTQNRPEMPVLLTSACSDFAQNLPDERLFVKPYDPETVEAHIRHLLGEH
ncbi:MAG TPA: response regulator [Rhizomicrobium sp.]